MNFLRNNKLKKSSALFLLAVLVFINAVKTFHTHDFSYLVQTEKSTKNATAVKAVFFCAICDFQIAKDSDAEVATLEILSHVKIVNSYYHFISDNVIFFSVLSSVRGPPFSYC